MQHVHRCELHDLVSRVRNECAGKWMGSSLTWAKIATLDEFIPTAEARERALFAPDAARALPFVQTMPELYELALLAATS